MAIRKRSNGWPPWTRKVQAISSQPLNEPLRSTLRRIDEQFLGINKLILEAYSSWPQLKSFDESERWSILEQDEPYLDGLDAGLEQHEDTALLGRLADLVCPEIWADFLSDINRLKRREDGNLEDHVVNDCLASVSRRKDAAAELYESVRGPIQQRGFHKVMRSIEVKISLVTTLLVVNGASEAFNHSEHVAQGQTDSKEAYNAWIGFGRLNNIAVQQPSHQDVATLVAITSLTVLLCMLPFIPAWNIYTETPNSLGSTGDMDFWCLIQNLSMELLGIFTAVYPIRRTPRVTGASAQIWIHTFTVLGVIVTVCALPVYLYASAFWSSMLSFLGSAAQAFLVLQLALLAVATPVNHIIKTD